MEVLGTERLVKVATCSLGQWALDFDGNLKRTEDSIRIAKSRGCRFRVGPELELSGYGCEDHFLEEDTFLHCWESLATLLKSDATHGILCAIGMPVIFRSVRYNCVVWVLDSRLLLIRPKLYLADDGNYRESRWFTAWDAQAHPELEMYSLNRHVQAVTGQREVPFGFACVKTRDARLASETCEELFTPNSPHIQLGLNGVEIFANASGSHHNLRKLERRLDLVLNGSAKSGGIYLYANQQGCDGGRLYYDGCAMVCVNGKLLSQGSQFSVKDVEVVTAVANLTDVKSYRGEFSSRNRQATTAPRIPQVEVDFVVTDAQCAYAPSLPRKPRIHTTEEEIAYGPACWLWDYLRRSGAGGFFLPLSGGADSSATATMVGIMCELVHKAVAEGDATILGDVRRVVRDDTFQPTDAKQLANKILHTCYMGTEHSSQETRDRAKALSAEVGSYHLDVNIDSAVSCIMSIFATLTGKTPRFSSQGGTRAENLALQNVQARLRMVLSFLLAQLLPWVRTSTGFLLVLGSANVDEALRGYMTKYDCSSADINPIGGIAKLDLQRFLVWAAGQYDYASLLEVVEAPPSAELEPVTEEYTQTDEEDMGMTYEELGLFGRLRNLARCGPVSMFEKLTHVWNDHSPTQIAKKVKRFFFYYAINRHKLTVLTPSYHAENYSPDDNRFDHRPFLYNTAWPRQFRYLDALVKQKQRAAPTPPPPKLTRKLSTVEKQQILREQSECLLFDGVSDSH